MPVKAVYLDYAAATPLDPAVQKVMQPYFSDDFYNPSAAYLAAKKTRKAIDLARSNVAKILGARPSEVVFTAGASEANNLAIFGAATAYPKSHFVFSSLEHESVSGPMHELNARGNKTSEVKPNKAGIVAADQVIKAVNEKTVLVSVMYANNEIGTIQPLKEIASGLAKLKRQRLKSGNKLPLYFHTDAAQAANFLDLHVSRLGVDMMSLNGGKIYGPKQSGILFVSRYVKLKPLIYGGGQEMGLRSGTENIANIIGFAKALELAQQLKSAENKRLQVLQSEFIRRLQASIPSIMINGSTTKRLPNNVHVTIPNSDNERLIFGLDSLGIQCAAGSACSASKDEPSHVLKAIGLSDKLAQASLRFTMGRQTTKNDINYVVKNLQHLI